MNVKNTLCGILLTLFSFLAHAESPKCYLLLGLGQSTLANIGAGYERQLFASKHVTGGYQADGTSRTTHFGGGCDLNRYFSAEMDYRDGIGAEINSQGAVHLSVDGKSYEVHYQGMTYNVAYDGKSYDVPFDFKRYAKVRGYGLSLLGRYPLTESFEPYARLGVLVGVQYAGLTSSKFDGMAVTTKEKGGYLPIVGLGIRYYLNKNFFVAGEKDWYNERLSEVSIKVGFRF